MKKSFRVFLTPALWALFCTLVLANLAGTAHAKVRAKSNKQKGKQSTKVTTKKNVSRNLGRRRASAPVVRKGGTRLTKAERRRLAARRRAIIAARLRAIRARDEALRNSAVANVLNDKSAGEDLEVRRAAIDALGGRAGTVVVMDPNDGRIFTVVNQQMALGSPVKPCSTVKLIVGLAALHEGVFDPNVDVPEPDRCRSALR
jgi:penicillin-binding protein 2